MANHSVPSTLCTVLVYTNDLDYMARACGQYNVHYDWSLFKAVLLFSHFVLFFLLVFVKSRKKSCGYSLFTLLLWKRLNSVVMFTMP